MVNLHNFEMSQKASCGVVRCRLIESNLELKHEEFGSLSQKPIVQGCIQSEGQGESRTLSEESSS